LPSAKLEVAGTAGTDGIKFPDATIQTSAAVITRWTNAGAATIGATVTAPAKGITTTDAVLWRRVGDSMEVQWNYVQTSGGTVGSGYYLFTLPSGYSIDTTKLPVPSSAIDYRAYVGTMSMSYVGYCVGNVYAYNTTMLFAEVICYNNGTGAGPWGSGYSTLTGNIRYGLHATVPISGW